MGSGEKSSYCCPAVRFCSKIRTYFSFNSYVLYGLRAAFILSDIWDTYNQYSKTHHHILLLKNNNAIKESITKQKQKDLKTSKTKKNQKQQYNNKVSILKKQKGLKMTNKEAGPGTGLESYPGKL